MAPRTATALGSRRPRKAHLSRTKTIRRLREKAEGGIGEREAMFSAVCVQRDFAIPLTALKSIVNWPPRVALQIKTGPVVLSMVFSKSGWRSGAVEWCRNREVNSKKT